MKKLKKLPKITGSVHSVFNKECIYYLGTITNAQSDAINYLVEVIEGLENRVIDLEKKVGAT